jgi:hypothetical protein
MLTSLVAVLSTPASALSCVPPGVQANVMQDQPGPFPVDGELVLFHNMPDVPTDLPWMLKDGVEVTYQADPIANGALRIAPGTFQVGSIYEMGGPAFQVADVVDDGSPNAPVVDEVRRFNRAGYDGAGDRRVQGLLVASNVDVDAAWLEVEVAEQADFSDAVRFGSLSPSMNLGRFDCQTTWLEYEVGTDYLVRARQVDLSGNRSDWSDAVGTGCSSAPAPTGLLALCPAMFVFRRARRGRTPASRA